MSHKKQIIDISGMHCRSCEILLEERIGKVGGITKVIGNHTRGTIEIEYDGQLNFSQIEKAVVESGYSVGKEDKKSFFSTHTRDYKELTAAAIVLFGLYVFLRVLGVFNFSFDVGTSVGLAGILLIGLTAGVSTCMALVGGLVLGISARHAELHPEATIREKFVPHVFFNLGRLISFVVLGGIIGVLGSALRFSSGVLGVLTMLIGFVMIVMGLKLIEIFPRLHNTSIGLPKSVARFFGVKGEAKEYSHVGSFVTGVLTFFLPCGFTQAVQLYAVSTGSFTQGALVMGVFALGTLPGILGIGGLTSSVKGAFARLFFKFAGLVVIVFALLNIVGGYNLLGLRILPERTKIGSSKAPEVMIVDGKQVIEMTQNANGYSPRSFTVKKGVPVVWKIRSTTNYTCAAYINMPSMRISQPLSLGENTIEFTPATSGNYKFTCSMGMYSGTINVID